MKYTLVLFLALCVMPIYAAEIDTEIDTSHRGYDLPAELVPGYVPVQPAEAIADQGAEGTVASAAESPVSDMLLMIGLGVFGNNKPLHYNGKNFDRHVSPALHITMNYFFSKYFGLGFSLSHAGVDTESLSNYMAAGDSYYLEYRYVTAALLTSFRYQHGAIEPFINLGVTYDFVQVEEQNNNTGKMDNRETDQAIGIMIEGGVRHTLASDLVVSASVRYNYTQNYFHGENDINFGGAQAYLSVGYCF